MTDYSRGDYASLPADTTDLENNYSAPDLTAIGSNDNSSYAVQTSVGEIAIHQYKKTVTGPTTNITWSGKSNVAPSTSPVILQVYNVDAAEWQELDRDDTTAANTDFDITYNGLATADYLDTGVITFRVYQSSTVDYWPVAGVTKPQHLWPFSQTGNYSDQGSTGGVTLSAAGAGGGNNTFGAGGLILDGTGWAAAANNADFCDIGDVYSLLIEFTVPNITEYYGAMCAGTRGTDGWSIMATWAAGNIYVQPYAHQYTSDLITAGTNQQVIVTLTGVDGTLTLYHNGSSGFSGSPHSGPLSSAGGLVIGAVSDGYGIPGTIKRAAVLKGTCWSGTDVSAIWSSLP